MNPTFPDPQWFRKLGELADQNATQFQRLGYAETRFALRIIGENGARERLIGLEFKGYGLADVRELATAGEYRPDFVICASNPVWQRMLAEIRRDGRPMLRGTLNSLVLMGDEMWLESTDQLLEDKFYRFNQTLQEFFNLAAALDAGAQGTLSA